MQAFVQIRNGLELYRSTYGSYPVTSYNYESLYNSYANSYYTSGTQLIPSFVPQFIAVYPFRLNSSYTYYYTSNGNEYFLFGANILENSLSSNSIFRLDDSYSTSYDRNKSLTIYTSKSYLDTILAPGGMIDP